MFWKYGQQPDKDKPFLIYLMQRTVAASSLSFDVATLRWTGRDLHRPECVLATAAGDLFTSDWRGGVMHLHPDGQQTLYRARCEGPLPQPNGIALRPDGVFLLADLSDARAGVWALSPDGTLEPFLLEVQGKPLPPVNFVCLDRWGRTWVTVSTRRQPRALDYRPDAGSGFIILIDGRGARVVADGLGYANECTLSPDGDGLYVNETFGRRLTRFRVCPDGTLTGRETVATFGAGIFPDGLALDAEGGLWITSIVSNRVLRVDKRGTVDIVLEDSDSAHLADVEAAFQAGTMGRPHLDRVRSAALQSVSSLAFGGPSLQTAYLGCLLGDRLATFDAPLAGLPPVHWTYEV